MVELFAKGQYALHQESSDSKILKAIVLSEKPQPTDEPVFSNLELLEVDQINKRCRWQLFVPADQLSKDGALALAWLALEYIFEKLQLKKVQVEILSSESSSVEFHRRLGFCEEGRLVRQVQRDEKFWDVILMAQFKDNWDKKKKNLEAIFFEGGKF